MAEVLASIPLALLEVQRDRALLKPLPQDPNMLVDSPGCSAQLDQPQHHDIGEDPTSNMTKNDSAIPPSETTPKQGSRIVFRCYRWILQGYRSFLARSLSWMGSNKSLTILGILTLGLGVGGLYVAAVSYNVAMRTYVIERWKDCQDRPVSLNDRLNVIHYSAS